MATSSAARCAVTAPSHSSSNSANDGLAAAVRAYSDCRSDHQLSHTTTATGKQHSPTRYHTAVVVSKRLEPLCGVTTAAAALPSSLTKTTALRLSSATRLQWQHEANAALEMSAMQLALEPPLLDLHREANQQQQLASITHPVLALDNDLAVHTLLAAIALPATTTSGRLSPLHASLSTPAAAIPTAAAPLTRKRTSAHTSSTAQSLHARCSPQRAGYVAIEPLVSTEMRAALVAHVDATLAGDAWQSHVRSQLARPFSASVFCDPQQQQQHPLNALQYVPPTDRPQPQPLPLFPYTAQAHASARRISTCYRIMRFRVDVKTHARQLALALQRLRRLFVPQWRRWHCRRYAAAQRIQRCVRQVLAKRRQHRARLQSYAAALVHSWTTAALRRAGAQFTLARWLQQRVRYQQQCRRDAYKRSRVLLRWVAKTRVCLFVHVTWCAAWLRRRREHNVEALALETHAMEQCDAQARRDFATLCKTSMGAKAVTAELVAWRLRVQHASRERRSAVGTDASSDADATSSNDADGCLARLRSCFCAFDLDGSGALDRDEFALMLSYLRTDDVRRGASRAGSSGFGSTTRAKLTPAQTCALFDELDSDGDGAVTSAELEAWWQRQHIASSIRVNSHGATGSASTTLLASGLDRLVLESHGLLFWLCGRRQQLERTFVTKQLATRASDLAKRAYLSELMQSESSPPVRRCRQCGRRFELLRDVREHMQIGCTATQFVVDTFVRQRWVREEQLRLLDDAPDEAP